MIVGCQFLALQNSGSGVAGDSLGGARGARRGCPISGCDGTFPRVLLCLGPSAAPVVCLLRALDNSGGEGPGAEQQWCGVGYCTASLCPLLTRASRLRDRRPQIWAMPRARLRSGLCLALRAGSGSPARAAGRAPSHVPAPTLSPCALLPSVFSRDIQGFLGTWGSPGGG